MNGTQNGAPKNWQDPSQPQLMQNQQQMAQQPSPTSLADYTLPGIINYLTSEFTNLERYKIMTSLEKNEMKYQILHLQGEVNALKFLNDKQTKKIHELELENDRLRNGGNPKQLSIDDIDLPEIDLQVIKESRFQLTKTMREVIQLLKTPSVNSANYLNLPDPNDLAINPVDELLAKDNFVFQNQQPAAPHQPLPTNKIKPFTETKNDSEPSPGSIFELKKGQLVEKNGTNGTKDHTLDIFTEILNDSRKPNGLDYFDKRELVESTNSESQTARDINNFVNSQSEIAKSPPLLPHDESDADTITLETDEEDANEEILEKIGNLKPNDFPGSPSSKFKRLSPSTSASLFINDDLLLNDNKTTPSPSPSPPISELSSTTTTNPTSNELSPLPVTQLTPVALNGTNYRLFSNSYSDYLVVLYFNPDSKACTSFEVRDQKSEFHFAMPILKDVSKIVDIFTIAVDTQLQEYKFIVVLEDTIEFVGCSKGNLTLRILLNATAMNSGKVDALDLISIDSKFKKDSQTWALVVSFVNKPTTKIKVFDIVFTNGEYKMVSLSQFTTSDTQFLKWFKNENARRSPSKNNKNHKKSASMDESMLPYEVVFNQDNKVYGWNMVLKKKTVKFDLADGKSRLLLHDNVILYASEEGVGLYNLSTEEKFTVSSKPDLQNWAILSGTKSSIIRFDLTEKLAEVYDTKLQLVRTEKLSAELNKTTELVPSRSHAYIVSPSSTDLLVYPAQQ